jgi:hypothetical protein
MNRRLIRPAKPLADEFKQVTCIKDRGDVLKEIAHLHNIGVGAFSDSPARTIEQHDGHRAGVPGCPECQFAITTPRRAYFRKLQEQYVAHVTNADAPQRTSGRPLLTRNSDGTETSSPRRPERVERRDPRKICQMTQAERSSLPAEWAVISKRSIW